MKLLTTTFLIFMTFTAAGKHIKSLDKIGKGDTIPSGQAIIYGNFIQRLGFTSGGFPQDIRIINVDTKEVFTFRVKPTFTSFKENTFIYSIKPGKYAILNYWWTQSKWYGGKMHTEPIYKNIDATDDLEQKLKTGQVKADDLKPFTFTITKNSLNYSGSWHFDTGLVSITNDKTKLDESVKTKYKNLDFSNAQLVLPN